MSTKVAPDNNGDFTNLTVQTGKDPLPYLCNSLTKTIRSKLIINMDNPFGKWADREFESLSLRWGEIERQVLPSFYYRLNRNINYNSQKWRGVIKWLKWTRLSSVDDPSYKGIILQDEYLHTIVSYNQQPGVYTLTNVTRDDMKGERDTEFAVIESLSFMTNNTKDDPEQVEYKLAAFWYETFKTKTKWSRVEINPYSRIYLITMDLHGICNTGYFPLSELKTGDSN